MPKMPSEISLSLSDVLFVAGCLLLVIGLALLSVPVALVVVGSMLMAGGIWSHFVATRAEAPKANETEPNPPEE